MSFALHVDWGGDAAHALRDVSDDVDAAVQTFRGRTFNTHAQGRVLVGTLSTTLTNASGKYSSLLTGDGGLRPQHQRVRVQYLWGSFPVWTGRLDSVDVHTAAGRIERITLRAFGTLGLLHGNIVGVPLRRHQSIARCAVDVLAAAGLAPTEYGAVNYSPQQGINRSPSIGGANTLPYWWAVNADALNALLALEETEQGQLFEDRFGIIEMRSRDERIIIAKGAPGIVLSDTATGAGELSASDETGATKDVANHIRVSLRAYDPDRAVARAYTLPRPMRIPPEQSITIIAEIDAEGGAVLWGDAPTGLVARTAPGGADAGEDALDSLTITTTAGGEGTEQRIRVRNTSAADVWLHALTAGATVIPAGERVAFELDDDASIAAYGLANYAGASPLFTEMYPAQDYAKTVLHTYAHPLVRRRLTWRVPDDAADARYVHAVNAEIGDLLTATFGGQTYRMSIDSIRTHRSNGRIRITVDATVADTFGQYWVLADADADGNAIPGTGGPALVASAADTEGPILAPPQVTDPYDPRLA